MKMKRKTPSGDTCNKSDDGGCMQLSTALSIDVSGCDLSSADSDEYFLNVLLQQRQSAGDGDDVNSIPAFIESLDLSRCRLGPNGVSQLLLSFLSSSSSSDPSPLLSTLKLKRICLQRNAIGSAGGRAVGRFLSLIDDGHGVEVMDISLNDIKAGGGEPTAAEAISDALKTNTSLKVLVMDKCALGPEGAAHLANALIENKSLRTLELAGNMIGPVGGDHIFRALKSNSSLEELGLKMNRIGGGSDKSDVRTLSDALVGGCCCRITKLDLSYNDLRCLGCIILSEAMAGCALKELILEKNDILEDGAVALANALGKNGTLQKLVLKGNTIFDTGAIAVGEMLKHNKALKTLDLSSCSIGNEGGAALGHGLGQNSSLEHLLLDKNSLGSGGNAAIFSVGVSMNQELKSIHLLGNGFAASGAAELWGKSIADALSSNSSLQHVNLSNNSLSNSSIVDAAAGHSSIEYLDISDNNFEHISIETQLILSKRLATMEMDLSLNPLSSPPLGRLATHSNLQSYLTLLSSEKTAVTRIRLMVLGYGGVGKSTFCRAITNEHDSSHFKSSLVPVQEWGVDRLADWAGRLGTPWSIDAVRLIVDERVSGGELTKLVDTSSGDDSGNFPPSKLLLDLCSSKYKLVDPKTFARAISALSAKGYLSTVGAVKVDGTIELGDRTCSLVDFAGQVEFLVSHQLLLSSMHTLCMVIQPAPSFGKPDHRHFGSWDYWSKFLSSLGDRRQGSLLLAVSQLDKVAEGGNDTCICDSESCVQSEFTRIKCRASGAISCNGPLKLDYCPGKMAETISSIKATLSKSLDEVAHSWWVPLSYETLAEILQAVAKRKSSNYELPKLTRSELMQEIDVFCAQSPEKSMLLSKMKTDKELLQRAINYLEAVGDVMQAGDEWLLIDPIGWFSSFLAHFIKDDLAVSTVQVDATTLRRQRGTINLDEIVHALKHDYKSPQHHVSQIMSLLCGLELCVPLKTNEQRPSSLKDPTPGSMSYLFPCLLPPLMSQSEFADWELTKSKHFSTTPVVRGHRFREVSGFIPPGLFVGILARMYQRLQCGVMHPVRMWRDHAILVFNNEATRVLLVLDLDKAIIDVIGLAPQNEQLFVGAAKGQASIVIWIVHLIKMFLHSYSQLNFEESRLCSNPQCHGIGNGCNIPSEYRGSEFLLSSAKPRQTTHDCDVEGCWRFLGTGHSLERVKLCSNCVKVCQTCNRDPIFALRDKIV
ncbi:hypothetical protein ACHAXR_012197 [Thalassiosira sp. AJA248-18]